VAAPWREPLGAGRSRRRAAVPAARRALPPGPGTEAPHPALDAVGEALREGRDPGPAAHEAGSALAREGWPLEQALDALHGLHGSLVGGDPCWTAVRALGAGWGDTVLSLVGGTSCEDPLTGLAGAAHLRTRVRELFRAGPPVVAAHALLVVEDVLDDRAGDGLPAALRRAHLGQQVRTVVPGDAVVADLGPRLVVLVARDERLHRRAALLQRLVVPAPRTWVEGLPPDADGAAALLCDLTLA